jgi:hypothetical protein
MLWNEASPDVSAYGSLARDAAAMRDDSYVDMGDLEEFASGVRSENDHHNTDGESVRTYKKLHAKKVTFRMALLWLMYLCGIRGGRSRGIREKIPGGVDKAGVREYLEDLVVDNPTLETPEVKRIMMLAREHLGQVAALRLELRGQEERNALG